MSWDGQDRRQSPRHPWDGHERRSSLSVSGPWHLRIVLVGGWSILWLLIGLVVGLGACVWAG